LYQLSGLEVHHLD